MVENHFYSEGFLKTMEEFRAFMAEMRETLPNLSNNKAAVASVFEGFDMLEERFQDVERYLADLEEYHRAKEAE